MVKLGDIAKVLESEIKTWSSEPIQENIGTVAQIGDSVARIRGLDKAVYGELVEFSRGATGIVMNLEEDGVGCVLLSGESLVKDGDEAKGTGKVMSVPVGPALIGRVVDPLGQPLDGKGAVDVSEQRPVESPAPGLSTGKG